MSLTVGSLFSGIGGLDLGLQRAGMEIRWHSEIDPYACEVLARHWPGVPNLGDITAVDWSQVEPVDVICGGFPCQDLSTAGRRAGIQEGTRSGLWFEFARGIRCIRPLYVIVENVSGLLTAGMDRVLGDLAAGGFDAEWQLLPAAAFGAPHRRDRLFIIAYPERLGPSGPWQFAEPVYPKAPEFREADRLVDALLSDSLPFVCGGHDGIPAGLDSDTESRLKVLGNAVVPQVAEYVGRCVLGHYRRAA